jgi:tungstate transport system substrate-binding protein
VAPLTKLLMTTQDLKNIYSVDLINQALHPSVNSAAAECLAEWLVSESGQRAIADYKVNGVALFQPFADDIPHTLLPARSESAASPVSSATLAASSSP